MRDIVLVLEGTSRSVAADGDVLPDDLALLPAVRGFPLPGNNNIRRPFLLRFRLRHILIIGLLFFDKIKLHFTINKTLVSCIN